MKCSICRSEVKFIFSGMLLNRHLVSYFWCESCNFLQTEAPYWLSEAYTEPIVAHDVGYVARNLLFADWSGHVICEEFDPAGNFLDYGSGYGLLVRLMRDRGFHFHGFDKYCKSIFAHGFEFQNGLKYELTTAFEVLEHLENPVETLREIFEFSTGLFFSTELIPRDPMSAKDWWYLTPETGQHISFFSQRTLETLAKMFNMHLYSNGQSLHILSRRAFRKDPFRLWGKIKMKLIQTIRNILSQYLVGNKMSLTTSDFEVARRNG